MSRFLMIIGLVLVAMMSFTTVAAASPSGDSAPSAAVSMDLSFSDDGDIGIATSYFNYRQNRGTCSYRYKYQRSKAWIDLYYNDGTVYALELVQRLQYQNSRGRWVTARSSSKTGYVYGGTGYMSINKRFNWSNRTLRSRPTRVQTEYRLWQYGGGYKYVRTWNNRC